MMPEARNARDRVALLAPPAICVTMYASFRALNHGFGPVTGYFLGFLLYWVIWCGAVPVWILGTHDIKQLLRSPRGPFGRPAWAGFLALGLPLLLGYGYAFPRALAHATAPIIVLSALLAAVNGFLEELLWRGVYISRFGDSVVWGYVYPTIGFAAWHCAPLSVHGNSAPGGSIAFIAVSGGVGLLWGWLARHTRSIRWTAAAHVLFDFSGLGGRFYLS